MVGWDSNMQTRNSQTSDFDNGIQSTVISEFLKSHDHTVTYILKILEDCFNMNPQYGRTDYLLDVKTIIKRYSHEGLSFATKTLPSFFDSLLQYLESGNSVYPSFKLKPGKLYPVFLQQLVSPIYEDHTSDIAVVCMKCLYQLCVAFKKLKGPYKQCVLVKQLDEFVSVDQSLEFDWSDDDNIILDRARDIITHVLSGLNPFDINQSEKFLPRPGPGATNSPTKKNMRYRPHNLYTQLARVFPPSEWYSSVPTYYRGARISHFALDEHMPISVSNADVELTSRFKFVHKTFGKPRCICIEELEMQWLQQALRRALYDRIENHPLTKGYVSFTDQSINGKIALLASKTREYATIDMSSASDRIAKELVIRLFSGNEQLLRALMCLSTDVIELPKDVPYHLKYIRAKKYAPMGSALCFPVMGLIHFALIKSILQPFISRNEDSPVWVYGDDIIIRREHANIVFDRLPAFGMKLNVGKSFVNSLFRESCGVNAYNGILITPVRFKTILLDTLSVNTLVGTLVNESDLHSNGYHVTAKFIRSELYSHRNLNAKAFPYVGRKSSVLGFIRDDKMVATNKEYFNHFKCRGMVGLQRMHYKTRVIVDISETSPPISDEEYYLRKLVERPSPFETTTIKESSTGLSIHWKWLPDSAFYCG